MATTGDLRPVPGPPDPPPDAIVVARRVRAPAARIWSVLGDSDRIDRVLGLPAAVYTVEVGVDGLPVRVGRARQGPVHLEWEEAPYDWNAPVWLFGERRFRAGPVSSGGVRVLLSPEADGSTRVEVAIWGRPRSFALRLLGPFLRWGTVARLRRLLDEVARASETGPQALERARDRLDRTGDPIVVNDDALARRLADARDVGVRADVLEALESALRTWPEGKVSPVDVGALAEAVGRPLRDVASDLLAATRAGLLELAWQVDCPVCRVAAAHAEALSEVGRRVHCGVCQVDYDVDFADHVEAVFRPHPSVRPHRLTVRCASSPAFRPHVRAQVRIAPKGRRTLRLVEPPGHVVVRTLQRPRTVEVAAKAAGAVRIAIREDALEAKVVEAGDEAEDGVLRIDLQGRGAPEVVLVEDPTDRVGRLTGRTVATLPAFYGLFGVEAARAGVELSISRMAILFTDLTGSTALYDRIGDAAAFEVVQRHFRLAEDAVAAEGGAVVKTIGDAVMAAFDGIDAAVRAARRIVRGTRAEHGALGLGVRAGAFEGPLLAVDANDRLDFFGTTVNLAARLEHAARTGELVLPAGLERDPRIAPIAAEHPVRHFEAQLKGVRGIRELVALDFGRVRSEMHAEDA